MLLEDNAAVNGATKLFVYAVPVVAALVTPEAQVAIVV